MSMMESGATPDVAASRGPQRAVRVLIVDDHRMVAEVMADVLARMDDIQVTGIVHSAADARASLAQEPADVILLDQRLPDGQGTRMVPGLLAQHPDVRIVLLTAARDEAVMAEAFGVGCAGFLNKGESVDELTRAVRVVAAGGTTISRSALSSLFTQRQNEPPLDPLTPRESQVLALLAEGASSTGIAAELRVSHATARNHIQRILSKLHAHSQLEAVSIALREGLIAVQRDE